LPLGRVLDFVPRKVDGNTRRKKASNCFRKGGRDAMSTPTESSVADQMARLLPSQVGSRVLSKAESSTVFTIEQAVALV
jgi:hypothetical protein